MNIQNGLPNRFIRGIFDEGMVDENGFVKVGFIQFQPRDGRDDGWIEESINWEDDENVISFTLNQTKKTGEIKFRGGVAPILLNSVHALSKKPRVVGNFLYERNAQLDNPYHGNLLLHSDTPSHLRSLIVANLAMDALPVIRHEAVAQ